MERSPTRRRILAAMAGVGVAGSGFGAGRALAGDHVEEHERRFQPTEDGFGFANWSTVDGGPAPSVPTIGEGDVVATIREEWREPVREHLGLGVERLPSTLVSAIAKQIYTSLNQLSGTNGHCYGMVFAAQRYHEEPATIPLNRSRASQFVQPDEPIGQPDVHPVLDEIEHFHRRQFTDFYAWLGRRAAFRPRWIDYPEQLRDLTATVNAFGTAGITLVDTDDNAQHQVLVHDYEASPGLVTLEVYDPNVPASRYPDRRSTVVLKVDGERPQMRPYGRGYDQFVFNRYDRIVRARAEERGPFDRLTVGPEDVRSTLFDLVLFLAASPTVSMVVVGPDGRALDRDLADFMDRSRSTYEAMRYRYGASPGTYRVVVLGEADGRYEIEAMAASIDGTLLEETIVDDLGVGEVHRYEVAVPETPGEAGDVERVADGASWSPWIAAAGGAAAAGAVALGHRTLRGRRSGDR